MLAKLLKYDFKSMLKTFVPLWLVLLVVSGVNHFILGSPNALAQEMDLFSALMILLYVLLIVAVMVVTIVLIVVRFYQGLLKDEGYLMFTIPVPTWQLIASKLISALVISLLSVVAALISVVMLMTFPGASQIYLAALDALAQEIPNFTALVVLFICSLFVGLICAITQVYAALALGHLASSHRVGFAVLAFILLNMAWSGVGTLIGLGIYPDVTVSLVVGQESQTFLDLSPFSNLMITSMVWGLILNVVRSVVHFFLTHLILSRRLNLE